MPAPAKKPATTPIPVQLSEAEFTEFILPHLSMPRRGPRWKLGYHHLFNLVLWVLYTGMQWKCLPVPKAPDGTDAIRYTTVYKVFARWSDDASLEHAFVASVGRFINKKPAGSEYSSWRWHQHGSQKRRRRHWVLGGYTECL